jgi:hypothetical protein
MKKLIFILVFYFPLTHTFAQREADAMYFGGCFGGGVCTCNAIQQGNIFYFNEDSVVNITDPACLPLKTFAGKASFSDRNTGEFLFASNGWRLINGEGTILTHKLYLDNMVNPNTSDTTNVNNISGPLFLPFPGDTTKAYLFYGQLFQPFTLNGYFLTADKYFTYALLDIPSKTLISKNNIILSDTSASGDIQACRHANGRDWWIIKTHLYEDQFYIGLLTPNGINMNLISISNLPHRIRANTFSQFNIQGTKFIHYTANPHRLIHEYNFDRCNGTLTNLVIHDISDSIASNDITGNISISPNGSKFYIKRSTSQSNNIIGGFFQVDLATDSMKLISRLAKCPQMTPNGKNIIFSDDSLLSNNQWLTRVSEIENPDAAFNDLIIHLYKYNPTNALLAVAPSTFAYMRLGADSLSICDSLSVITKRTKVNEPSGLVVFPNPAYHQLNLTFEKSITGYIIITDALGKVVYSYAINNPIIELPIDIANFTDGIYYLSYRNKEVSIYKKFIKQ